MFAAHLKCHSIVGTLCRFFLYSQPSGELFCCRFRSESITTNVLIMIHADVTQVEERDNVSLFGAGRNEVYGALHVARHRAVLIIVQSTQRKINGTTFLLLLRPVHLICFIASHQLHLRLIRLIIAIITQQPFLADDFRFDFGIK